MKNNNKTHRRTQSSSFYDFRNLLPNKLKENNVNTLNFIENHQVPDRNLTKEALDQSKNSQLSAEKTVFVENLNPSLPDLNKKEDNFLVFGKKNRNYSSLFGYEEKIFSMKSK